MKKILSIVLMIHFMVACSDDNTEQNALEQVEVDGQLYSYCPLATSDVNKDGWGEVGGQQCVVKNGSLDPDASISNDNNNQQIDNQGEAEQGDTNNDTTSTVEVAGTIYPYCASIDDDPDGDGWGWTGEESCVVRNAAADPNGDGSALPEPVDVRTLNLDQSLINPNATPAAKSLFTYLLSIFGEKTLSGQQDLTWKDETDMYQRVINDTGKEPAIMGYDFMNMAGAWAGYSGSGRNQHIIALEHWQRGGIVTFCWHWRMTGEFYTDKTSYRIPMKDGKLYTESVDFTPIVSDIREVAIYLQYLEDAGVPVLWRPLHEASGGWFWWGAKRSDGESAAEAQIQLWQYIYHQLTDEYGLDNLIWVWNGQAGDWYPGDEYVDIISMDLYGGEQDYQSRATSFFRALNFTGQNRMIAASENSNIPDPDLMQRDNAMWLYFVTWNDGASSEGVTNSDNFWTGEYYNTNNHKNHVYHHDNVITLDELPNFN